MLERGDIGGPHRIQQLAERRAALDAGPQHEGVDEHADHVVERVFTASRHWGADRDIGLAAQTRQQRRQCRMGNHEQGRAVGAGELRQAGVGTGIDVETHSRATARGHRRTRPIRRQVQLLGQAAQRVLPVRNLLGDHRFRIVLGTEHLPLPEREIGVLHRQRLPSGFGTGDASAVGEHHISGQRPHREAVGRNVVHQEHEHVLGGAHLQQPGPQRHLGGHVEGGQHQIRQALRQFVLGDLDRRQIGNHPAGRHDLLIRGAVAVRVAGAQRLVPRQHIGDRDLQRLPVQQTRKAYGHRDVVDHRLRIEPVEEPHALLRQRQRHSRGPRLRHQRQAQARTGRGLHPRGQRGHR